MKQFVPAIIFLLWSVSCLFAEAEPDTLQPKAARQDTMYVIPAGPIAGSFTSDSRVSVLDTVAGWAKINVEAWVPVGLVLDRMKGKSAGFTGTSAPSELRPVVRSRCEAITQKGTRCKRYAKPGFKYCWQHQPD